MNVLFLTNNPNLCSTSRILQSWLSLGRNRNLHGHVVLQNTGDFANWLASNQFDHLVDPMPWPDRRWPVPSIWHAWKVARWAKRRGVRVIHCNEHDVFPFAILLRRLLGCPVVCHVRFVFTRAFAEWAFAGSARRPDALLWTSFQQKDDCASAISGIVPEEQQHVVHLGIDLATFGQSFQSREPIRQAWGVRPHEIVIGTASPLRPRKRVEDFVELVAVLAKNHDHVVGIVAGGTIAGDEDYRDKIVQRIHATDLGRRLRWIGNMEPVEPFYHGCDIVVSTSEYETFGNSVCEAMACGKPVAAYRGGSVHEVVDDDRLIVDTGDLAGLTSVVERLLTDSHFRSRAGARGKARVLEELNPTKRLEQLLEIYHSFAIGRSSRAGALHASH